jgi:Myb-like DNA-binding domain
VADLGQQWEKIHPRVGRMASDCRDRYRNHLLNREIRVNGAWSPAEEQELTRIVTDMTVNQGRDPDNDVFWGKVSELMGGRRGRQQCRIKWFVPIPPFDAIPHSL